MIDTAITVFLGAIVGFFIGILYGIIIERKFQRKINKSEESIEIENEEVDLGLYEVLDRSHVIQCQFDDFIANESVINQHEELKQSVDNAQDSLMAVYQIAAKIWHDSINTERKGKEK